MKQEKIMATKKNNNDVAVVTFLDILEHTINAEAGIYRHVTLWKYKGKKFKFIFENSNGTPLGFDDKHCILAFNTNEDTWKRVADKRDILGFSDNKDIDCENYYALSMYDTQIKMLSSAKSFDEACVKYIKLLYD